jgi:hypothetical protein
MKKKLFFLSIAASFILLATSCKKDDPKGPNVTGYWTGSFGQDANALNVDCSVLFRSNGTTRWYYGNNADTANAIKADGSFTTIAPSTAKGSYKFVDNSKQSFTGTVNAGITSITGSVGSNELVDDIGFFTITK